MGNFGTKIYGGQTVLNILGSVSLIPCLEFSSMVKLSIMAIMYTASIMHGGISKLGMNGGFFHPTCAAAVVAQDCEQYTLCRGCITLPQCTWCSDDTVRPGVPAKTDAAVIMIYLDHNPLDLIGPTLADY